MDRTQLCRVPVTLSADDTRKVLAAARCRWVDKAWESVAVLYRDKWLELGRTDLHDDVRTGAGISLMPNAAPTPDDPAEIVARFIKRVVFGARVTEDGFFVIDRLTDG